MLKRLLKLCLAVLALGALTCLAMAMRVQLRYLDRIHTPSDASAKPIAIVLGASVKPDASPSDALQDRILTAVELYRQGKVSLILMTGDDGAFHVDEVTVMASSARALGVPPNAIMTDGHGYRTYESCKRAVQELHINSALIVTQRFHLGRALYLCNHFGMNADGVIADHQTYIKNNWFWMRDLLSSVKAFWDVHVLAPESPVAE